ncbi:MAG: NAD+ synthase [Legionella sp.]|nr:NAD+ synthase [Legionella sp.]
MADKLNILMAQINPVIGDFEFNKNKISNIIKNNQDKVDIIVFPELALTGYPPEDLLFRKEFHLAVTESLAQIQKIITDCYVLLGYPTLEGEQCYNSVGLIHKGQIIRLYHKQNLPNYDVFDEARYFLSGPKNPCVVEIKNYKIGLCICEDLWKPGPVEDLIAQNVCLILSPNASPFDHCKHERREALLRAYASQGVAFVYVNQMGGQDEILFDGQSFAMDKQGVVCARSPAFEEQLSLVQFDELHKIQGEITPLLNKEALIYKALVCGTKDYVHKNKFPGVLLGLSGGIDSALTLAIAVDALGPESVQAVMMPSRYSAQISHDDALEQILSMKVSYSTISIEPSFKSILSSLEPEFTGLPEDTTEENIQARIRGMLLMALSNKFGNMVLTTSNKSETAVGYATLYGDMAGGLAVLKDVLKTQVYALAHYRNSLSRVIPERVFTRAPSAELRENQADQDSLPDYATLDAIIEAYMIDDKSPKQIIEMGLSSEVVLRVIKLIKGNEYKRRQGPLGLKISPIAFGKDWRYPISTGF